jgi:hypothetical protein
MPQIDGTAQVYQVPLSPRPQRLSVTLLGVTFNLRTRWSNAGNCWLLDLSDVDMNPLIGSIPLVTGADLLEQYGYLGIGGGFFVQNTSGPPDTVPGFTELGTTSQLIFAPYVAGT